MKKKLALVAAIIAIAVGVVSQRASAHHGVVSCTSEGVWTIDSWDSSLNIAEITSFNQSGATVVSGLGTNKVTVKYSGTVLSGEARWENGNTGTFYGEGSCTTVSTTSTTSTTETPMTTTTTSSTVPQTSSTTSSVPTSSVPETSSSVPTTSTTSSVPSSTSSSTSTPPTQPSSTQPGPSSPMPGTPSGPELPATGVNKGLVIYLACLVVVVGVIMVLTARFNRK